MKYDISKPTAPKMPDLGRGTECIKILISQASKDMQEPFVPMFFPVLGAHISGAEFQYPDNSWKELCGQMANLVAESGGNKGQILLFQILFVNLPAKKILKIYETGVYVYCIVYDGSDKQLTAYRLRLK